VTPLRPIPSADTPGLPQRVQLTMDDLRTVINVHDAWRVGNRWWRGETPSLHLLVDLTGDVTAEIYADEATSPTQRHRSEPRWRIERLLD